MSTLKVSTTYNRQFWLILASDHHSPATGAAPVVNLSKNGGAFGTAAGTVTEIAHGFYQVALTAADTGTVGDLSYFITGTGADPQFMVDQVQAAILTDYNVDASGNVSIASSIKKNANLNGFMFLMTNSTTHAPQTGLTVTAQRSLAGAGFAPCANSVVELSNGVYTINLAATDVNSNSVMLRFTASGADDLDLLLLTQP